LYLDPDDSGSRWFLAQADGTKQPALGLAVEAGDEDDDIRVYCIGEVTNAAWSWTPGGKVYLDPSTPGALTQVDPVVDRNIVGVALTATTLFLTLTDQGLSPDPTNKVQPLVCADLVEVDWSLGSLGRMVYDRAAVEFSFSGAVDGQRCVLQLKQSGESDGGSATLTYNSDTEVRAMGTLASPPTLSADTDGVNYLGFIYDADDDVYDFVSVI
jgi:hypothetical protein